MYSLACFSAALRAGALSLAATTSTPIRLHAQSGGRYVALGTRLIHRANHDDNFSGKVCLITLVEIKRF